MPNSTHRPLLALAWLALLPLGCSGEPNDDAYETPTFAQPGEEALDMTGRYAFELVQSQYVHQPVGDPVRQVVQTVAVVELLRGSADGADPEGISWQSIETCAVNADPIAGTESSMGTGYYRNLPRPLKAASLSAPEIRGTFTLPPQVELVGVTLSDPVNEALPTSPDDPRVFDQDEDGRPGYTVILEGPINAELLTINRIFYGLEGTIYGPDRISGLVEGAPDESVLESSKPNLVPVDTQIDPDTEASHNYFNLVRIPEGTDCAAVLAQLDSLFEG